MYQKVMVSLSAGLALCLALTLPMQADEKKTEKKEADQVTVDPKIPKYEKSDGVSGELKSIGSDTMKNLLTLWAEGVKKATPNVKMEIEGKGSATAPPALIQGTAQFGPMSRPMKDDEIAAFEK